MDVDAKLAAAQVTMRMTAGPASCLTALVTSSLVSRTAVSVSTGTCQDWMADRTRRRASAAAAGPVASRTRHPCLLAGRGGAIVVRVPPCAGPAGPEASGQLARCSRSVDASIHATCIAIHRSADGYREDPGRRQLEMVPLSFRYAAVARDPPVSPPGWRGCARPPRWNRPAARPATSGQARSGQAGRARVRPGRLGGSERTRRQDRDRAARVASQPAGSVCQQSGAAGRGAGCGNLRAPQ